MSGVSGQPFLFYGQADGTDPGNRFLQGNYQAEEVSRMAERVTVDAQTRTTIGKQTRQLRRDGQRDPVHIQIENLSLRRALREAGTSELIDIAVDGGKITVLAREIQQHATRGDLLHVDFYEVNMRETIQTDVRLVTVGNTLEELRIMGQIVQVLHQVTVECLPGDLISEIEVDISGLTAPDQAIYVSDLTPPAGVTILTDPETAITSFEYFREEEEEEAGEELLFGEEGEEVEVIARGKAADEDEEDEA
jgi:large subunit ribosomal protein L25